MAFKEEFDAELHRIEVAFASHSQPVALLRKRVDHLMTQCRLQPLTTFDTEKYEVALTSMARRLRKEPRRFRFKTHMKQMNTESGAGHFLPLGDSTSPTNEHTVASHTVHEVTTIGKLTRPRNGLVRCVVYEPDKVSSVRLDAVHMSIILLPDVTGPVHFSNITDSVVVAACQQCRVHESRNVIIYLSGCENPVIENCTGLGIGNADLGGGKWVQVSDFSWLQKSPSPNWKVISDIQLACIIESEEKHAEWLASLQGSRPSDIIPS